ncbi:MAG TPA: hypothetical protein VGQ03_06000 [Nitrososphaera sp.]|nr:hypothetical protein [Nitrososphaera sp.]
MKGRRKDPLENQVPEYGLEALVSTIKDRDELISAIKASRKR